MSSRIPSAEENSCITPSKEALQIAAPGIDELKCGAKRYQLYDHPCSKGSSVTRYVVRNFVELNFCWY